MTTQRIQPTTRPASWALRYNGEIAFTGETIVGDVTVTGHDLIGAEGEPDALAAMQPYADEFPALPNSGWLEQGDIYNDGGTLVMVRQSHARTEHAPADVPALFVVYRADAASVLDWVPGERVEVGALRTYEGVTYQCVQGHQTQADYEPPDSPALWRVYVDTPDWVQPTGAQDAYNTGDRVVFEGSIYESLIDANVWSPTAYPAGWQLIGPA